ncbi:MAG: hypothetical protein JWN73_3559 [Betaproteobacteria bacterium]|nr:hypothetical protein [Betaproteobacteria bacterium]
MQRSTFVVTPFDAIARAVFAEAMEIGLSQGAVDALPPGNIYVDARERGGKYAVWRRTGADGKALPPAYLGLEGSDEHEAAQARLADLERIERMAKNLRKLGFAGEDHSSAIVLAALANSGVFEAGAVLVGTRAFNCIANHLGYKLPSLATQDVDVASPRAIKLARPLEEGGMLGLLRGTGLKFVEIPGLRHNEPSASWRVVGREIKLDLLVSARSEKDAHGLVPLPALGAHASALQSLDFLLPEAAPAMVVGKSQLVPVRVPAATRFCWHKIAVAELREQHMKNKAGKDLQQAGALATCLAESGALDALLAMGEQMPPPLRGQVKRAFPQFLQQFGDDHRHVAEAMARSQGLEQVL